MSLFSVSCCLCNSCWRMSRRTDLMHFIPTYWVRLSFPFRTNGILKDWHFLILLRLFLTPTLAKPCHFWEGGISSSKGVMQNETLFPNRRFWSELPRIGTGNRLSDKNLIPRGWEKYIMSPQSNETSKPDSLLEREGTIPTSSMVIL